MQFKEFNNFYTLHARPLISRGNGGNQCKSQCDCQWELGMPWTGGEAKAVMRWQLSETVMRGGLFGREGHPTGLGAVTGLPDRR